MSGNVYFVMMTSLDMVTYLQERFILVTKKYAINVRNTIFYQVLTT